LQPDLGLFPVTARFRLAPSHSQIWAFFTDRFGLVPSQSQPDLGLFPVAARFGLFSQTDLGLFPLTARFGFDPSHRQI